MKIKDRERMMGEGRGGTTLFSSIDRSSVNARRVCVCVCVCVSVCV